MIATPETIAQYRHSVERGDVVLCNLPPYYTQPWLSMGVVLHYALLAEAGIVARVVRPLDPPFSLPELAAHASLVTFTFDPTLQDRLQAMAEAYAAAPAFFDQMVDALLAGDEAVIGLSVFRSNVDVTLLVARLIKERRPHVRIVIGGPEAIEDPALLLLPFVDAVVGADAEAVIVAVMRALLADPAAALGLKNVWVHEAHGTAPIAPPDRPASDQPARPTIRYAPILRLLKGERGPTVPLLLNWGCPYHCSYCSNRVTYSRFGRGSQERLLEEIDGIVDAWRALHDRDAPQLNLQLSDASTNALPEQLDDVLRGVVARTPRWGTRPYLRGQTLFDARVTQERLKLWREASFESTFFGLDGANDLLRRGFGRPGTMSEVTAAVATYLQSGGALTFGVLVGLPGETEAHFQEALRFVDWTLQQGGRIETITVLPYLYFRSAQGPAQLGIHPSQPRGVLWRADVPGGDPSERADRFMRVFDHVAGRAPTLSPIPPYLALPAMMGEAHQARVDTWMARHGRLFDQMIPGGDEPLPEPLPQWDSVAEALAQLTGDWSVEQLVRRPDALIAVFRRDAQRVAVSVEHRDETRKTFAFTRLFNVSYLSNWLGIACDFDAALVGRCLTALDAVHESTP